MTATAVAAELPIMAVQGLPQRSLPAFKRMRSMAAVEGQPGLQTSGFVCASDEVWVLHSPCAKSSAICSLLPGLQFLQQACSFAKVPYQQLFCIVPDGCWLSQLDNIDCLFQLCHASKHAKCAAGAIAQSSGPQR